VVTANYCQRRGETGTSAAGYKTSAALKSNDLWLLQPIITNMNINRINKCRELLPSEMVGLSSKRSLALVKPSTIADLIELDQTSDGKYELSIIVNQTLNMASPHPSHPAFVRLPKNGERCPVSSLSRSTLQSLIRGSQPKVESIVINVQGRSRGCRAIVTSSLLNYLNSYREGDVK
jgi:hypothetical protein